MKKLIALLLALALCLASALAVAEELPALTLTPEWDAQVLAIPDSEYTVSLPADWTVLPEQRDGYTIAMPMSGSPTLAIGVLELTREGLDETVAAYAEKNLVISDRTVSINDVVYRLVGMEGNVALAMTAIDDAHMLSFSFTFAGEVPADETVHVEILCTLAKAE